MMILRNTLLAVSLISLSLTACNSNNSGSENSNNNQQFSNKDWKASELAGTYRFEQGGDTIMLDLKNQNDSLVGDLSYSFKEKDHNHGTFSGVLKDSLLVGQYHFMSEGVHSVRETVFGIVPDGLIEGFGEVEQLDSIIVFKHKDSLRFDHGMVLQKQ